MKRSKQETEASAESTKKKKAKKRRTEFSGVEDHVERSGCEGSSIPPVGLSPSKGRRCTVSIALPGSIIDNAQTQELKTYLAGQIARAACIFNVDEIVVFDELPVQRQKPSKSDPNLFLARVLQYLETPQYLRKALFAKHADLRLVGLLNPLDCPHHMRIDDQAKYREGVVLDRPTKSKAQGGSYVNAGMRKDVCIDKKLKPGVRVTIELPQDQAAESSSKQSKVVPPSAPRVLEGLYWGYTVRFAHSFGAVFTQCPFEGGYDLTIGTSERGTSVDKVDEMQPFRCCCLSLNQHLSHLLIVFGGLKGLEASLESDESLKVEDVSLLFDLYLNTCPQQGSRTIRTEEAILVSLAVLRPHIAKAGQR